MHPTVWVGKKRQSSHHFSDRLQPSLLLPPVLPVLGPFENLQFKSGWFLAFFFSADLMFNLLRAKGVGDQVPVSQLQSLVAVVVFYSHPCVFIPLFLKS